MLLISNSIKIVTDRLAVRGVNVVLNKFIAGQNLAGKWLADHARLFTGVKLREILDVSGKKHFFELIVRKHFDEKRLPKPQMVANQTPSEKVCNYGSFL
jgi:hypothetical protein